MKALKLASTLATPYAVIGLSAKDGKLKIESGAATVNEKALLEILKNLGATGKSCHRAQINCNFLKSNRH